VEYAKPQHPDFINILDRNNESPLYDCVGVDNLKAAERLITLKAWMHPPEGSKGKDVFIHAAIKGRLEILELLVEKGATFDLSTLKNNHEIAPKSIRFLQEKNKGSKSGRNTLSLFGKRK